MRETAGTRVLRLVREGEAERRRRGREERRKRAREEEEEREREREREAAAEAARARGGDGGRGEQGQDGPDRRGPRIVPLKPEAFYGRCRVRDITRYPRIANYLVRVHRRLRGPARAAAGPDGEPEGAAPAETMAAHFRVFPRQAFAFRFIDMCNCDGEEGGPEARAPPDPAAGADRLWPFSFEEHVSGRRRFLATSHAEFSRRYFGMPGDLRHCYEIIREGAPCHAYFDLEFARGDGRNELRDGDAMVDSLLVLLQRALLSRFGIDVDGAGGGPAGAGGMREHVLELDSSTPSKFSRHLVVVLPGRRAFASNIHAGAFVKELVANAARHRGDDPVCADIFVDGPGSGFEVEGPAPTAADAPEGPGRSAGSGAAGDGAGAPDRRADDGVPFVDLGVYTRNRAFRLPFSSKAKKAVKLMPTDRLGFRGLVRGPRPCPALAVVPRPPAAGT